MHRRSFLRAGAGVVGAGLVVPGTASGRQGDAEEPFEPLGSVDVPGAAEAVVHDDGFVYVAAEDGFAVVDIESPESPELVAERRDIETGTDPLRQVWDLWPWEERLLVAGPAGFNPQSGAGFALFDISDPTDPAQITFYRTDSSTEGESHYVHNSHFEDGIVYLTGSGIPEHPLVMIDVGDDDPREVGRWSIVDYDPGLSEIPYPMRPIHDVYVQDGIAYLPYWDAGTWIVDVSDPGDPTVLSRTGDYDLAELRAVESSEGSFQATIPPGNAHFTTVDEEGTLLAVSQEAWATPDGDGNLQGGAGGVKLYDVREKTAPELLARIEAPESSGQTRDDWFTTAHNCEIDGDRLYTSWYFGGVKVHDVSDPTSPEELAWWRNPREASFWTAQSAGDVFVGSSTNVSQKVNDSLNETRGAVYVFPDRAGEQRDPPSLTDRSDDGSGTEDGNADGGTAEDGSDDGAIEGGDTGGTTDDDTAAEDVSDESTDSSGPGLGAGTAVAGLAGYYLLARDRDGE